MKVTNNENPTDMLKNRLTIIAEGPAESHLLVNAILEYAKQTKGHKNKILADLASKMASQVLYEYTNTNTIDKGEN